MENKKEFTQINSLEDLKAFELKENTLITVLFYKKSSEKSMTALDRMKNTAASIENPVIAMVDVEKARDIHKELGVTTVPTVVTIKDGRVVKKIEGLQSEETYRILLANVPRKLADGTVAPPLRISVYTTQVCPHCSTVKKHLKRKGVPFREIDVSKDQDSAAELQRRTGQTGVPQTDINGTWVMGADLGKIDRIIAAR
ncbi:MAG: glutaredoxin [Deltaproteobacteria bacterium]|nr:glutaredoxin [Deltaproteobacteria bacterium]